MTITRDDVAKRAGVSSAVVSYVLNNGPRPVAKETREKVLQAISELGYQPNYIARSLRGNRTHTIGVIVPDSSNHFYSEVTKGSGDMTYTRGYSLILGSTNDDLKRQTSLVENFISRKVDGLIFITMAVLNEDVEMLDQSNIPAVYVSPEGDLAPDILGRISYISLDSEAGGYAAGRHLVGRGHIRLACITGGSQLKDGVQWNWNRVNGFTRAVTEGGGNVKIVKVEEHPEDGHQAGMRLLSDHERPTAIFTSNDMLAIGVLRAAADMKLEVPQDLAVCGFDDITLASYVTPRLTTVRVPKYDMGYLAAKMLLGRLDEIQQGIRFDQTQPELKSQYFSTELIVRESS